MALTRQGFATIAGNPISRPWNLIGLYQ